MSVRILILLLVAGTSVGCQSTGSTRNNDSTTVICTTDDERSLRIEAFLDDYQAEGVEFFWGTPEEPFDIDGWREAMRAQHDQFDEIVAEYGFFDAGRFAEEFEQG